ncbi:MAG: phage integrase SAM-like domain-containing protein [Tannerella sp.]|jgi:ribosome-associated toxin RatA of RatAB toxin-antitoxin module|nr:phage integrase SAM-like domain-containing protein [Tannerella sp.]
MACKTVPCVTSISKYNLHDIPVKEVNLQFLGDLEVYLFANGYSKNTVVTIMKKFRHIIEIAMNKEWIYRNPFKEFKLQWQKVDRGYLTQSELEAMIDFRFEGGLLGYRIATPEAKVFRQFVNAALCERLKGDKMPERDVKIVWLYSHQINCLWN